MSLQPATKFQASEETHKLSMVLRSTMIFKFVLQRLIITVIKHSLEF